MSRSGCDFLWCVLVTVLFVSGQQAFAQGQISGELKQWHRVALTFDGPQTSETASPNPFADYRAEVVFSQGDHKVTVPGFYAADGNAAQTSAKQGKRWRVHFTPDRQGKWAYRASFRKGKDIALNTDPQAGDSAGYFDGATGEFNVGPSDKTGRDHRGKGILRYVGGHYLQFAGSKEYFLKGGADSPENFLAYADFDGTYRIGKLQKRKGENFAENLHHYEPHIKDWKQGDPTWKDGKGKAMIGALNYLASQQMNSVYFLTMNVTGDGKDVWPWIDHDKRDRFDCSKLDQWEIVFSHMDKLGIMLHVITQETENDQLLDGGALGRFRKLYYRELIARFAHHPAVTWNLGEENTNTDQQRRDFCSYFQKLDPYDHQVVVHTYPGKYDQVYNPLLNFAHFEGPSLQTNDTHRQTIRWIDRSGKSSRKWIVSLDEIGPANTGVKPDKDDPGHDQVRSKHLWGHLMAGGAGVEWYFGYKFAHNDLNCEDWRSRQNMWDQTRYALTFFHEHLPFTSMRHADALTTAANDYCFAQPGYVYAIYLPKGGTTQIDLPEASYSVRWYNPRKGGKLLGGSVKQVNGPGKASIGNAPADPTKDWVALLKLQGAPPKVIPSLPPSTAGADRPAKSAGKTNTAKPAVGGKGSITGFTLINADTDKPIKGYDPIKDGATIDLGKLPSRNISIRANVKDNVRAVQFDVNGKTTQTERTAPFALAGDTNGNYNAWSVRPGKYTLSGKVPGGKPTQNKTISFTIR